MTVPPIARQLLVAGSTHLAALSAGGMLAYPGVLLQQLKSDNSTIQLDLHKGSWVGSVHGLAGIPSFLTPFLMQYIGRKFAFMLSCLLMAIGWACIYAAQSIILLIIGECFHGLGGHSLVTVSLLSISEMVQPKYRQVCLVLYPTYQAFGITMVGILGTYFHWKIVGLIMCSPLVLALIIACTWLQSPSWLAYKGRVEDCERIFKCLRGTDMESRKELNAVIKHYSECLRKNPTEQHWFKEFQKKLTSRDFYLPCLHTLVLISVFYWTGGVAVIIYSGDIILKITGSRNDTITLIQNILLFIGYVITSVMCRYCSSKKVLLFSMSGSAFSMMLSAIVLYLKSTGAVSKDSMLGAYCVLCFIIFFSLGASCLGITTSTELVPVKHKGIGGCWFVICICVCHSSALKLFPYLCVYINMWGAFLIYAVYATIAALFIWTYVPDTRNRTLQEIEDYYSFGYFKKNKDNNEKDSVHQRFLEREEN